MCFIVSIQASLNTLQKALNLFNAALVTPTYYVFFTSSTIITSAILFRGFKGTPTSIITVVMGFLQICAGVVLLQLSKSAKDVPDVAIFSGDLDQVRTVAEQEQPESEPKADAIRGTAAIMRRLSSPRQMKEVAEAKRVHEDRLKDQMEPIGENERVQWDGLKRRKTIIQSPGPGLERKKTLHPPFGMSFSPIDDIGAQSTPPNSSPTNDRRMFDGGYMNSFIRHTPSVLSRGQASNSSGNARSPLHPVPLSEFSLPPYQSKDTPNLGRFSPRPGETIETSYGGDSAADRHQMSPTEDYGKPITWADRAEHDDPRLSGLPPNPPPHGAKRKFSFQLQNVFHRSKSDTRSERTYTSRPPSRLGHGTTEHDRNDASKSGTEEERLGLVKGDSNSVLPPPHYTTEDEEWELEEKHKEASPPASSPRISEEQEIDDDDAELQKWIDSGISPERRGALPTRRHDHGDDDNDDYDDRAPRKEVGNRRGGAFI